MKASFCAFINITLDELDHCIKFGKIVILNLQFLCVLMCVLRNNPFTTLEYLFVISFLERENIHTSLNVFNGSNRISTLWKKTYMVYARNQSVY